MATVNFSVPEEVKRLFDKTFKGRNKSAVVAELMRRAVEEEEVKAQRREAGQRILARRSTRKPVDPEAVAAAREELRK